MTITARFAGTCPVCRRAITVGQSVEWTRGQSARHTVCPAGDPSPVVQRGGVYVAGGVAYDTPRRFTCRRCGEHRDTTITGRCDDCDN